MKNKNKIQNFWHLLNANTTKGINDQKSIDQNKKNEIEHKDIL